MKTIQIVALLIFSVTALDVNAQATSANKNENHDFRQVAIEVKKKYEQVTKVHIAMSVRVFEKESSTPFYSESVEVYKDSENYLCHLGKQDMLMNGQYIIMANHAGKQMTVNKRNVKGEEKFFKDPVQMSIDTLFSLYGEPQWMGRSGELDHFRLTMKKGDIEFMDFFINTNSSLIKKIEYRYKDKQYALVEFKVFDVQPRFEPGLFDEQNYISVVKNVITPSKNFSSYKIFNAETEK